VYGDVKRKMVNFFGFFSTLTGNHVNKAARYLIIGSAYIGALSISGCGITGPRPRLGSYPTSTLGAAFVSTEKLGGHSYGYSPFERNGIAYTCKGGHIDIAHLRVGADNTKYIAEKLYKGLLKEQVEFSFGFPGDRSKHIVRISYPENWGQLDKEPIAREVSLQLGQYVAFCATTWHEMLTWFGYHTVVVVPEFSSAFSWEDIYSNLLGTHIAVKALRDTEHKYSQAMTLALHQELKNLGGQSARVAKTAAQKVRDKWFKGNLAVSVKKRNLDIGLDDGYITPMIVPGVCQEARPEPYPVPNPDVSRYGFSMAYHILPREFEKGKILRIVYPDGKGKIIKPEVHFAPIMARIREVAVKKYGPEVAMAYDPDRIIEQKPVQIAAAASVKESEPVQIAAAASVKESEPVRIAAASGVKESEPVRIAAAASVKESKPVRIAAAASVKKYDPFQELLESSAKKHDFIQKLWEFGVKKHGPMSSLR